MTNAETKPLNKLEVWVSEHAVPIFAAIAVMICLGAVAVFVTYQRQGDTAGKVKVLSPQVTRISRAICDRRSADSIARSRLCAGRIRYGLVACRHSQRCRAAFLALLTYPPPAQPTSPSTTTAPDQKGGATQQPSNHGHQHPSPGSQPGHHGGGKHHGGGGAAPAPTPASPAPSPAPSAPEKPGKGPPVETPGKGPPAGAGGGSSSGAGVELCVLERTCVGVEAGAQKGILP